ncbi:MAG: DoxX family protein [Deltaproteobacteria bacterium]|nr:DoxX family protein [Deltaproteobacteria bacterium]
MLERVLAPAREPAYAAMRVVLGLLWSFHGVQKIFGVLTDHQPETLSQVWIGGVIELVAGLLIAVGLFTRWAAFIASGTMAVAYIQFHWKLDFGDGFFPAVNKGELAVVYCFVFLVVAAFGPGRFSLDAALRGQKARVAAS